MREGGRELGLVTVSHSGKHGNTFYKAWSAVAERHRFDLAAHTTLKAALDRIVAFDADPEPLMPVVHRVSAEAVEKRR